MSQPFWGNHVGCDQGVHVIWHDHVGVKLIALKAALSGPQSVHHDCGNLRHAKMRRTMPSGVQASVHRYECSTGADRHLTNKDAICWEGTVQTECHKQRLPHHIPMRQPPFSSPRAYRVSKESGSSQEFTGRADSKASCSQYWLPHYFTFFANLCRNFWTFGATTYEQYGCCGLLAKYS